MEKNAELIKSQIRLNNANATSVELWNKQKQRDMDAEKPPEGKPIGNPAPSTRFLVSFESGHYKEIRGRWKGDSVWCHFYKEDGGMVHINKDKVEYIETFND